MMLSPIKFLADENFEGAILSGVLLVAPDLDIVRVQEHGLTQTDDRVILQWAAENNRVLLTHDKRTVPGFLYERIADELFSPGVILMSEKIKPSIAIEQILMIAYCNEPEELHNKVIRIPL